VGSLRIPASFCGIYAHKPSLGLLPRRGHDFPGTAGAPAELPTVVGPLARCTADLELALQVLAGPDVPEATGYRLALPAPRHAALPGWRVLALSAHPLAATAAEVRAAVDDAAERLARGGASVSRATDLLPDLAQLNAVFGELLDVLLSRGQPGASSALSAHAWLDLLDRRAQIQAQWRRLFETFDALICPAFGCAAFEHIDDPNWESRTLVIDGQPTPYGAQGAWASMASLGGLPATAMPVGHNAAGLPLGIQIIGPYLEDRSTIALAAQLGQCY
jgi:amidase